MQDPITLQRVLIAMSAAQNERKARHYLMALQDDKIIASAEHGCGTEETRKRQERVLASFSSLLYHKSKG